MIQIQPTKSGVQTLVRCSESKEWYTILGEEDYTKDQPDRNQYPYTVITRTNENNLKDDGTGECYHYHYRDLESAQAHVMMFKLGNEIVPYNFQWPGEYFKDVKIRDNQKYQNSKEFSPEQRERLRKLILKEE